MKRKIAKIYQKHFTNNKYISCIPENYMCKSNYWLQTIQIENCSIEIRDKILKKSHTSGYLTRPAWNLISSLKPFIYFPKMDLSTAEGLLKGLINIPSSPNLREVTV
jgi:perosamine synthetase